MQYIIIGLGNFGASLAEKLVSLENEVIGVDLNYSRLDLMRDKLTHVVKLDSTDQDAVQTLPLAHTDVVIVAIGEDVGANVMSTAVMKQLGVKRLISRAITPLQETIIRAMGVEEVIHPEKETAERWARKSNLPGVVDSFEINRYFSVIETEVPEEFVGKTIVETELKTKYEILLLTTIRKKLTKNELEVDNFTYDVQGVASANTVLKSGEIMVVYGETKSLKRFLKDFDIE